MILLKTIFINSILFINFSFADHVLNSVNQLKNTDSIFGIDHKCIYAEDEVHYENEEIYNQCFLQACGESIKNISQVRNDHKIPEGVRAFQKMMSDLELGREKFLDQLEIIDRYQDEIFSDSKMNQLLNSNSKATDVVNILLKGLVSKYEFNISDNRLVAKIPPVSPDYALYNNVILKLDINKYQPIISEGKTKLDSIYFEKNFKL